MKGTEAAYRAQLDVVKIDFDAGDITRNAKVEAARSKIQQVEENHQKP